MGYLLDTCVVSDFVKGEQNTLKKIKSISPTDIFISSLTVMEVKYGLAINPQKAIKIQPLIESFLTSITVLPFNSQEAEKAAEIRGILKIAGSPIGSLDNQKNQYLLCGFNSTKKSISLSAVASPLANKPKTLIL